MGLSNYTRQALVNSLLGKTSNFGVLASAPSFFVGLSSTLPNPDGTGITEPAGGGYARVDLTSGHWGAATLADPSVSSSILLVTFPAPTADWLSGALLAYGVYFDALTGGNFLHWGPVAAPRSVLNGDAAPAIPIGEQTLELSDE